jgi:hypothetical protein
MERKYSNFRFNIGKDDEEEELNEFAKEKQQLKGKKKSTSIITNNDYPFEENFGRGMECFSKCQFKSAKSFFEKSKFPLSFVILGSMFSIGGLIGPKNENKMSFWFDEAKKHSKFFMDKNQRNKVICFCFGEYWRLVENNYEVSIKYSQASADQGYAPALNRLGFFFYSGKGVEKDCSKAIRYFQQAADQGHADAQFNLGMCYRDGEGVEKDLEKALHYFRLAADQGNSFAQVNIGACFKNGEGVEKDLNNQSTFINWQLIKVVQALSSILGLVSKVEMEELKKI